LNANLAGRRQSSRRFAWLVEAMLGQIGRLDAARLRVPTVEEEDFHGDIVVSTGRVICGEPLGQKQKTPFGWQRRTG